MSCLSAETKAEIVKDLHRKDASRYQNLIKRLGLRR